jgi:GT2 family glycosyltransferase
LIQAKERQEAKARPALPPASLIICSRNRAALLNELVESVLAGIELPTEIVVVDDSDTRNETLADRPGIGECQIRYLWTRSRGLSRANNEGIRAARHEILVFTQDDVLVSPEWFGTIVRALVEAGARSVVTGKTPPEDAVNGETFVPSTISREKPVVYRGRVGEGVLYVQNMAMFRSANDAVGGFDERLGPGTPFPAAEDNDYQYRLLKAGYEIVYCPDAVVYHRRWRSQEQFLPLRWGYGVGRGAAYAKHLGLADRFALSQMVEDVRGHLVGGMLGLRRERQRALGDAVLACGIVWGAARWLVSQTGRSTAGRMTGRGQPA